MTIPGACFDDPPWLERLAKWSHAWSLPGLESQVRIVSSSRMRVTLGLYVPRLREIRIAAYLLDAPPSLLEEVVCHEFAHAAVHARYRTPCRPHGREWRAFMREAGRIPRVRIPRLELDRLMPVDRSARVMWRHRCPRCHAERLAGRPVKTWRCGRCRRFGRGGRLEIERLN